MAMQARAGDAGNAPPDTGIPADTSNPALLPPRDIKPEEMLKQDQEAVTGKR